MKTPQKKETKAALSAVRLINRVVGAWLSIQTLVEVRQFLGVAWAKATKGD